MICYLHNIKLDELKYNLVSILDKYNEKIKRYPAKEIIFKEIRKIDEDIINLGEIILKNDFEIRESIYSINDRLDIITCNIAKDIWEARALCMTLIKNI